MIPTRLSSVNFVLLIDAKNEKWLKSPIFVSRNSTLEDVLIHIVYSYH